MTDKCVPLFHVGYIKTATTFLQRHVFNDASGLLLAAGNQTRAVLVGTFLLSDDFDFDPIAAHQILFPYNEKVLSRGNTPVWSEEMILGNPPSNRYDGFQNLRKIKLSVSECKILITIRNQQDIILSMYREYILNGGCLRLTDFIGTGFEPYSIAPVLRPDFLKYDRVIRHCYKLFGPENVLILPQELLAHDQGRFFQLLAAFLKIPMKNQISAPREHVSEKILCLKIRRLLNPLVQSTPAYSDPYSRRMLNALIRIVGWFWPLFLDTKLKKNLEKKIAQRFAGFFCASNLETSRLIGISLGELGYEVS